MFNVLRRPRPKISDFHCSRIKFSPGDRVLVRTFHELDANQKRQLRHAIEKWAGVDVEVLIYSTADMEITIEKQR